LEFIFLSEHWTRLETTGAVPCTQLIRCGCKLGCSTR